MTRMPLRSINISDFRRLKGDWELPLDAPIVLLHGPNGAGKTSVLSAIELALTGGIKSMRRLDERYMAHLPTHGEALAKISIEIADDNGVVHRPSGMTVAGSSIKGSPALSPESAQFYAERSYLDQVSLGQLLDLYQYSEGKQESALARFVNELLGLDQLDALRSGLIDAGDIRNLKRLSESYADASINAKQSAERVGEVRRKLVEAETVKVELHEQLLEVASALGANVTAVETDADLLRVARLLLDEDGGEAQASAQRLSRLLAGLGGRIKGLESRPATIRFDEARAVAETAAHTLQVWRERYKTPIESLREDITAVIDIEGSGGLGELLDQEITRIDAQFQRQEALFAEVAEATGLIDGLRSTLAKLDASILAAESLAGSLATSLAGLREQVSDNICPVCDRNFSEVSSKHLATYLDHKIEQITDQGRDLQRLSAERDDAMTQLQDADRSLASSLAGVLGDGALDVEQLRRNTVLSLRTRLDEFGEAIATGSLLLDASKAADIDVEDAHSTEREEGAIRSELTQLNASLGVAEPKLEQPIAERWKYLTVLAAENEATVQARQQGYVDTRRIVDAVTEQISRVEGLTTAVTEALDTSLMWTKQVAEGDRRRAVARRVHTAASATRTAIVQRVFTESLNDVWGEVFSRLAPSEPYVPAFGLPKATKTALELKLETIHESGDTGGTPSMMLSAGNLNTAALSLFLALHLAVDPLMPCLVLDDPVQSMDQVHISQFAGLLRVLSKQHKRQVIVAVHERELFDYLALELSPAYEGDELITIELGRSTGAASFDGVTRLTWSPDTAVAV